MTKQRVVVDSNVVVSALVVPKSTPGRALSQAVHSAVLIVNSSMIRELAEVLARPKFDRYVSLEQRKHFLSLLLESSEIAPTITVVTTCRDPKDNHVLEAAENGSAEVIITGDTDLLDLNPFHGIRILTPIEYLEQ
ncbi:MAG: putative toxin-antitoxin system toxin component, PIN family [Acidobacteriota bacterium]